MGRLPKILSTPSSPASCTKRIDFVKYQGLGNDFILIDNRHSSVPILTPQQAAKLCNRNFGIGADGVIFALPGLNNCDYAMRIYNSDGSEPQMCGNGIRCLAKFLFELESPLHTHTQHTRHTTYTIWTLAGKIIPTILPDGQVIVDMGEPILDGTKVPTLLPPSQKKRVVQVPLTVLHTPYTMTMVSMGNPHCVIFVDSLADMKPAFEVIGPVLETHEVFPERVNVEFVQVMSREHVKIKVGVG
ncbi:diaminopimelate epimerase [archaeon]|nr:MAG: diaminopimelate epimerase [archaeon]